MKAKKLPSGNWRVKVYVGKDKDGKQIIKSITAPTKQEAEGEAALWKMNNTAKGQNMTIKQMVNDYIDVREPVLSPSTIAGYKAIHKKEFCGQLGAVKVSKLDAQIAQKFVNDMVAKGLSRKTISNRYELLVAAANYFVPGKVLSVKLPQAVAKASKVPDKEDIDRITLLAKEYDYELYKAILLSSRGSLRRGEICALTAEDVDRENNTITVNKALTVTSENKFVLKAPKTKDSVRVVPYPPEIIALLPKEGRIVRTDPNTITKKFGILLRRNNLPLIRFHDLRHYFATMAASGGMPKHINSYFGGWKKTSKVLEETYIGLQDEELKKGAELLVSLARELKY